VEGDPSAQSRKGAKKAFRITLHPSLTAHWRNGAALVQQAEVDMSIVVRMKVILSPPGLILKERPRAERGFTQTEVSQVTDIPASMRRR